MSKITRRLTILFVVVLLAVLFIAKPFASELSSEEFGRQMGHSIYTTLTGENEAGK